MERRTLVRLLVVLGIGLPIAIEAATFLGLFESRVLDGGEPTPTATPDPDAVGVGGELLPATEQTETVTGAAVTAVDGDRTFRLTVEVENPTDADYELRLDALTTTDGTTLSGGGRSGTVAAGGTATVTGEWALPAGTEPSGVIAIATITPPDGESRTVTRRVPLAVESSG